MSKDTSTKKHVLKHLALSSNNIVQEINHHLSDINQALQIALDKTLAKHCRIANFHQGRLVIETDSPAWATKLRFSIPDLREKLRKDPQFANLKHIEYYVNPENTPKPAAKVKRKNGMKMSPHSASLLHTIAEGISDNKLSKILHKLAKSGESST